MNYNKKERQCISPTSVYSATVIQKKQNPFSAGNTKPSLGLVGATNSGGPNTAARENHFLPTPLIGILDQTRELTFVSFVIIMHVYCQ